MSTSHSLVLDGEDEETESEEEIEDNAVDFSSMRDAAAQDGGKDEDTPSAKKHHAPSETASATKKEMAQLKTKPSLLDIGGFGARSKFDRMRLGFGQMMKKSRTMALKPKKRGKLEDTLSDATAVFHTKTGKAVAMNVRKPVCVYEVSAGWGSCL